MIDGLYNFIVMDGYGAYVWSSYLATAAVFIGLWLFVRRGKIQALQRVTASSADKLNNTP